MYFNKNLKIGLSIRFSMVDFRISWCYENFLNEGYVGHICEFLRRTGMDSITMDTTKTDKFIMFINYHIYTYSNISKLQYSMQQFM